MHLDAESFRICKVLQNAGKVKAYGRHDTQEELCDCLDVYFEQLEPLFPLTAEIERCIQGEDEISDDASKDIKEYPPQRSDTSTIKFMQL